MLKNAGLQGSTLSDHHMTTGFGLFKLLTHGLLYIERAGPLLSYTTLDHSCSNYIIYGVPLIKLATDKILGNM